MTPSTVDAWLAASGNAVVSGARGVRRRVGRAASGDATARASLVVIGLLVLAAAVVAVGLVGAGTGAAQAGPNDPTAIESCGYEVSNSSSTYVLTADLEASGGRCITVGSDVTDVTIDGDGHEIRDAGSGQGSIGIEFQADGVTIRNVTVVGWHDGIYGDGISGSGANAVLENVTVRDSSRWGLRLSGTHGAVVRDSRVLDTERRGIRLYETTGSELRNVTVRGNLADGVFAQYGSTVTIAESDVSDNPGYGVRGFEADFQLDDVTAHSNGGRALALNESTASATGFDVGQSTDPGTTLDFEAEGVVLGAASDPAPAPANWTAIGRYFDADTHYGQSSLDVTLHYDQTDAWVVDESTLGLFRDDGQWAELPASTVDTGSRTVSASFDDGDPLGTFGAFGQGSPHFDVTVEQAPESVLVNDTATVTARITNTGGVNDTQSVGLTVAGEALADETLVANRTVTLDGGENETVTFEWSPSERGSYEATVASENDSDTREIAADLPANLQIDELVVPDSVLQGEFLPVTANVSNAGDRPADQSLSLSVDGSVVDTANVTLNGSETATVTLTWQTDDSHRGEYDATVSSADDSATTTTAVDAPAEFAVAVDGANQPLAGEPLTVDATVENVGDREATQNLTLDVAGEQRDSTRVTLAGGANQSVELSWATQEGDDGTYEATVASEDHAATRNVTVDAPSAFDVTIFDTNSPVLAGDAISVDVTVANLGDRRGHRNVTLAADGAVRDSIDVALNGSESTSRTLSWTTEESHRGEYEAVVDAGDDVSNETLTVRAPAEFDVSIESANDPIVTGDALTVDATVENVGDVEGTQNVTLDVAGDHRDGEVVAVDVAGERRDATELTLAGGANQSVELSWATQEGDAGTYQATVASEDHAATRNVTVDAPAAFDVAIDDSDSPVLAGDTLSVDVTVTNEGDLAGTQTVVLDVAGDDRDEHRLSLNGSETASFTLSWDTDGSHRGEYTATVRSGNASDSTTVAVQAPAAFRVTIEESNAPVLSGEALTVDATVENLGDVEGTQTVALDVAGERRDATELTLAGGANQSVELSWTTQEGDDGRYEATVASEDHAATRNVTVDAPAAFDVAIDGTNSPVGPAEPLVVETTVTNAGDREDTQTVSLTVNGTVRDTQNVTLAGGANASVSLEWLPESGEWGQYDATVASDDDEESAPVTVRRPAAFDVAIAGTNSPVGPNETVTVDVAVTNEGDVRGTQNVTLAVSNRVRDATELTLNGSESVQIGLEWSGTGDLGSHELRVASDDDSDTRSVTVEEADEGGVVVPSPPSPSPAPGSPFDVRIDDANSPVAAGETLEVSATITNEGDESEGGTATLSVAGGTRDSQSVELGSGQSERVTLEWSTDSDDVGSHSASVAVDGASDSTVVTVSEEPAFEVAIENATSPVVERQPLVVAATIEANEDDEQTVELENFAGETVDSETVALSAGESATVTLVWTPAIGDAGSGFLPVTVDEDSAATEVTVRETPPFAVDVGGSNSPVEVGETLSVDATVTNDGDEARTGYVTLEDAAVETTGSDGSLVRDGRPIALDAGESRTVTLEWQPESVDVGDHALLVDVGADDERLSVTVEEESSGLLGVGPEWTGSAVDYEPTEQTRHVGVFLWLTVIVGSLAAYVLVTRETTDARLLGVTLLASALRTGTDVLHATVGGITTEPLLALNTALELYVGLLFLAFAAAYVGNEQLLDRRSVAGMGSVALAGTATIAWNPDGLVFSDVTLAEAPFTYVTATTGPLGWVILTATLAALLFAVGLLVQSFLEGTTPAWRPVGVLATGLCLAVVFVVLSVLDRGPLPHYDYTGAGMAGFLAVTTTTLFGHGLQRIKHNAQRSLIEDLEDPIVIANDARIVVDFNAAAADLLPGLALGERFDRFVAYSPEWPAPGETTTAEESRSGLLPSRRATPSDTTAIEAVNSEHGERDPADDVEVHYLVRTTSVTADTADSIGYTVRFTDVTELKRRTNELARKNAQLEQVASTISHDLRNPLGVADGYLDLMEQTVRPAGSAQPVQPAALAEHMGPVQRALERMSTIIDDILALARGGEEVSETEAVEFGDLVQEAWATVDTDDATLYVDSSGLIDADPRRLRRILENLFRNAVEHASEDVAVVTGVTEDGFYVADDGPGIPPAEGEAIFEEGYSSAADGTGLGLAIVTQLARAHDWDVELDPDYDGARFVFSGCTTLTERERSASGAPQQD